jgi:hypothetical protein
MGLRQRREPLRLRSRAAIGASLSASSAPITAYVSPKAARRSAQLLDHRGGGASQDVWTVIGDSLLQVNPKLRGTTADPLATASGRFRAQRTRSTRFQSSRSALRGGVEPLNSAQPGKARERVPRAKMSAYWPTCATALGRAAATRIGGGFSASVQSVKHRSAKASFFGAH